MIQSSTSTGFFKVGKGHAKVLCRQQNSRRNARVPFTH